MSTYFSLLKSKFASINHAGTRFPLAGKHLTVKCSDCHKEETINGVKSVQYLGLPIKCQQRHRDVHAGQFVIDGET